MRRLGSVVCALARPIETVAGSAPGTAGDDPGSGDEPRSVPFPIVAALGAALADGDADRRRLQEACAALVDDDGRAPERITDLLDLLAAGGGRAELVWLAAALRTERGERVDVTEPVELGAALASHARRRDATALRALVDAHPRPVRALLAGDRVGAVLLAPVLGAVAHTHLEFALDVLAARQAPFLSASKLRLELVLAVLATDRDDRGALMERLDRTWSELHERWIAWAETLKRGALLPAEFGQDRWDARRWRRDTDRFSESAARALLDAGEFEAAAAAFAPRAAAGDRDALSLHAVAVARLGHTECVDVPPPGAGRLEAAAALDDLADRLSAAFDAECQQASTPGGKEWRPTTLYRLASLLVLRAWARDDPAGAHLVVARTEAALVDWVHATAVPPGYAYLRALVVDAAGDFTAPDADVRSPDLPEDPAQLRGLGLGLMVQRALTTRAPVDPGEMAPLLRRLGADPERHHDAVTELATTLARVVHDGALDAGLDLLVDRPSRFERHCNRAIVDVLLSARSLDDGTSLIARFALDLDWVIATDRDDVHWYDTDEDDRWLDEDDELTEHERAVAPIVACIELGDDEPKGWLDLVSDLEDRFAAHRVRRAGLDALAARAHELSVLEEERRAQLARDEQASRDARTAAARPAPARATSEATASAADEVTEPPAITTLDAEPGVGGADPFAGSFDLPRLESVLASLDDDSDRVQRLADRLVELDDPALDARWAQALMGDGAVRRAFGEVEADLELIGVLRRRGELAAARGIATSVFWRAVNGAVPGYGARDLLLLVEDLDASGEELRAMRTVLERTRDDASYAAPATSPALAPVRILFVGGNETQAQYHDDVDAEVRARYDGRVTVEWFPTAWSARWRPDAERIEARYGLADAVVLMRFMRTQLGRRLRRSSGDAGLPWIACTGHGRAALLNAIDEAVVVVDTRRR